MDSPLDKPVAAPSSLLASQVGLAVQPPGHAAGEATGHSWRSKRLPWLNRVNIALTVLPTAIIILVKVASAENLRDLYNHKVIALFCLGPFLSWMAFVVKRTSTELILHWEVHYNNAQQKLRESIEYLLRDLHSQAINKTTEALSPAVDAVINRILGAYPTHLLEGLRTKASSPLVLNLFTRNGKPSNRSIQL